MAKTEYDLIVGGVPLKIAWWADNPFRKSSVRREIEQNLISQTENAQLVSRADRRQLYQTSWAGGATWWKPLLTPDTIDSFFESNHMDTWSEPGSIVPQNQVEEADISTLVHSGVVMERGDNGNLFAIGISIIEDVNQLDVYSWAPGSNTFTRETGYSSGIQDTHDPVAMAYDPSDGYMYVLSRDNTIGRFNSSTNADDLDWISSGFTSYTAANITLHNEVLMMYNGEEVFTIDKGTPSVTSVFNDGKGTDYLDNMDDTVPRLLDPSHLRLAIATPEGFYYVKNITQNGLPTPVVFRVDRDSAGSYIGDPIATLPTNSLATAITHHMGTIVVTTVSEPQTLMENDSDTDAEVVLYNVLSNGVNALGSMRGPRDALDETPTMILGASGPILYLGGKKRVWAYDAVRGGLHIAYEFGTPPVNGTAAFATTVEDSAGDIALLVVGPDRLYRQKLPNVDDPETVVSFGDDETTYVLESNFFDANLPLEEKELVEVSILREAGDGNQQWEVEVAADEGAFSSVLEHNASGEVYGEAVTSGTTGYQFRYRLIYQTQDTTRNRLKAVMVTYATGEVVTEWRVIIDGTQLNNVQNQVQNEAQFYQNMQTLAATDGITTLIDNVTSQEQRVQDDSTPTNIKIVGIEINKDDKPGESTATLVMREA